MFLRAAGGSEKYFISAFLAHEFPSTESRAFSGDFPKGGGGRAQLSFGFKGLGFRVWAQGFKGVRIYKVHLDDVFFA